MTGVPYPSHEVVAEFRQDGGRVGGFYDGASVLLLTTLGRKSGRHVTTPLPNRRERDRLIVMGANVGAGKQPDWYCHLLADRCVVVEVGMEVRSAVAAVTPSAT